MIMKVQYFHCDYSIFLDHNIKYKKRFDYYIIHEIITKTGHVVALHSLLTRDKNKQNFELKQLYSNICLFILNIS